MSRRFSTCGTLGLFSALMMATALFLTIAFLKTGSSATSTVATHGTTVLGTTTDFVTLFNAVLAVSFSFVGQICVPSLIDEMDRPEDFGKSLWTVQLSLLAFFSAVGLTIYGLLGTGVPTPVIAALSPTFAKIVIGFTVPADICIGALFCFIAIKFLIDEVYTVQQQATRTRTVQATWIAATILFWSVSFLVAQLVPFFENLVSLMSAVFGSYFGFTLWSWTYFHAPSSHSCRLVRWALAALNIGIMLYGLLFFFAGGYSSIVAILRAYAAGSVRTAFSCANNGF
ncbi:Putative uncharacterized protein [Taphrina deformans PYCC 5710]|uniref:Amino acid transporter transmembrane domain-containing protein n=1 Tax=Taphrina deformans (strain PYCC 5710 / ATCC 11124 / CBS 356.35 / IMI 108563 / JCM 9778 / NBRC 8474) TaxID=1097556 RepID=R4X7N0_TAPDE|nr:Putative uncharacterized protein [Taphrina deformans PYCC 5710]|eukprot:CCG81158.1 Putative uncharacterized protein [Taphrina deformans PYCC 5710]